MARSDWNIESIMFYLDDDGNIFDIYEYAERISEDLPINYVASLLRLSKQRFVDILNEPFDSKKHLITSYEEAFRDGRYFFNTYNVFTYNSDLTIELLDFEDWLDDNYSLLKENLAIPKEAHREVQITAKERDFAALKAELEQARQEKAALQAELEKTKAELEKARDEAPPQGMTQQQRAALARSENALSAWKPVILAMVEIATIIGKEGPKERQTPDLHVYFNERDITITDEQMKVFRKALPAEYKDSVGGVVGKT